MDTDAPGFSRDQFGRQSMSEKRHASLDAKNTDTYQRNKKLRSVVVLFFSSFCFIVTKEKENDDYYTIKRVRYSIRFYSVQICFCFSFNIGKKENVRNRANLKANNNNSNRSHPH